VAEGKHERGSEKEKFCGIPGSPKCKCGEDYRGNCEPGWVNHTFPRLVRQKTKKFTFAKEFEAHHVLCVSCVSEGIIAAEGIDAVVRGTVWCINRKKNMLAMPLWGHTVKWYCDITEDGGEVDTTAKSPPFRNIPQHDFDHNCNNGYTHEVLECCKGLAKKVEDKGHDASKANLAGTLDGLSDHWVGELKARGRRNGGTHKSWKAAQDSTGNEWCKPFSMANDAFVSSKSFPNRKFDESLTKWIDRIATAIAGG